MHRADGVVRRIPAAELVSWYCPCGEYGLPAGLVMASGYIEHRGCGLIGPIPCSDDVATAWRR